MKDSFPSCTASTISGTRLFRMAYAPITVRTAWLTCLPGVFLCGTGVDRTAADVWPISPYFRLLVLQGLCFRIADLIPVLSGALLRWVTPQRVRTSAFHGVQRLPRFFRKGSFLNVAADLGAYPVQGFLGLLNQIRLLPSQTKRQPVIGKWQNVSYKSPPERKAR